MKAPLHYRFFLLLAAIPAAPILGACIGLYALYEIWGSVLRFFVRGE
jgi:anthranilate/para-aminobenzoate synthase component II